MTAVVRVFFSRPKPLLGRSRLRFRLVVVFVVTSRSASRRFVEGSSSLLRRTFCFARDGLIVPLTTLTTTRVARRIRHQD